MNGKDIFMGLRYIDEDIIEEAEFGVFPEKTVHRTIRRPLLVAAIIAMMLLLVGCAVVYVLRMQDVKIGEATETRDYRLVDGTYVEDPHEVNQSVLTLAGLKGTKAYQASADFFAFKEEYTQNMEAMMSNGTLPEDFFENDTYGKAMNEKTSELAAQYGLKPEGESLNFRTTRNMCDALGIERFVEESEEISARVSGGSCNNTGNFYLYFDFDFPEEQNYEVLHTSGYLRWNRTDCFSRDYVTLRSCIVQPGLFQCCSAASENTTEQQLIKRNNKKHAHGASNVMCQKARRIVQHSYTVEKYSDKVLKILNY